MRLRIVLVVCLSLLLTACQGGFLPTPTPPLSPTLRTTATRTPLRVLAATATATGQAAQPTPASLWEQPPEIAAGLFSPQDRDRYLQFVRAIRARDEVAGDWLVTSGLFIRDGSLDPRELRLIDVLLQRKDDPLWYLCNVRTLDGLSDQDLKYLEANDAPYTDAWNLEDDITGLEAAQLLSGDGRRSLQRLFEKAREDSEVRKGLYLINTLGLPDSRLFKYTVPAYNVQLLLLSRLLERGLPADYDRAAAAAALTYGSLATLAEPAARDQIIAYAAERVRFLIDTDVLLAAAGARWRSTSYPLEALMLLLWGGQSSAYTQSDVPLAQARSLGPAWTAQPLTKADLARLLVPLDTLRQMQDEMLHAVVERTGDEATASDLVEQWWGSRRNDGVDEGGPDMNRQWQRYRSVRGFAGGVSSAYVLQGLAASINLPLPWAQLHYTVQGQLQSLPYGLRLDAASRTLQLSSSAQRALASLPPETKLSLAWWRVPWDNWHLQEEARSYQTLPLPLSLWRAGVPSGYLLRQGPLKASEAAVALGVPPTPTPIPTSTSKPTPVPTATPKPTLPPTATQPPAPATPTVRATAGG